MNEQKRLVCNRFDRTVRELMRDIDSLCGPAFLFARYNILNHMKCKLQELAFIGRVICSTDNPGEQPTQPHDRTLTKEELQQYDGRDGKPAYVAVNGVVYDVTNNAAWAAATHFGLSAGKDVTEAFASCHPGQPILNKLKVVGKLIG